MLNIDKCHRLKSRLLVHQMTDLLNRLAYAKRINKRLVPVTQHRTPTFGSDGTDRIIQSSGMGIVSQLRMPPGSTLDAQIPIVDPELSPRLPLFLRLMPFVIFLFVVP